MQQRFLASSFVVGCSDNGRRIWRCAACGKHSPWTSTTRLVLAGEPSQSERGYQRDEYVLCCADCEDAMFGASFDALQSANTTEEHLRVVWRQMPRGERGVFGRERIANGPIKTKHATRLASRGLLRRTKREDRTVWVLTPFGARLHAWRIDVRDRNPGRSTP